MKKKNKKENGEADVGIKKVITHHNKKRDDESKQADKIGNKKEKENRELDVRIKKGIPWENKKVSSTKFCSLDDTIIRAFNFKYFIFKQYLCFERADLNLKWLKLKVPMSVSTKF